MDTPPFLAAYWHLNSQHTMTMFHHPESPLQRAKDLIADGRQESLFYAALGFRYSVESHLLQYAKPADTFAKNKEGVWKVRGIANARGQRIPKQGQTSIPSG